MSGSLSGIGNSSTAPLSNPFQPGQNAPVRGQDDSPRQQSRAQAAPQAVAQDSSPRPDQKRGTLVDITV